MKQFEIWSEGYAATGDRGVAVLHGEAQGETFREAVLDFARRTPSFARHFDERHMEHWGCQLFDNERDARESFG